MRSPRLVLASGSARRRELLDRLGLVFEVARPDVDESRLDGEDASTYVRRVALAKVEAVRGPDTVTIAADTAVVVDDMVLGKPLDADRGRHMLASLAGRSHEVVTAVAVGTGDTDDPLIDTDTTTVHVETMSRARMDWYVSSGEGGDKAGGYALQGAGGLFADRVDGSVSNVIGLPLPLLDRLCQAAGFDLLSFRRAR